MRPWSSRRQRLLLEHGQYGRPGVLNSTPGQSPDRPGLTERVRLKSPEGYGGYRAEIQARSIPLERVCFALMTPGRQSSVEKGDPGGVSNGNQRGTAPAASDGGCNRSAAFAQP